MPVLIGIDGRFELWGSPRLGLSPTERQDFDALHARHSADEHQLDDMLGSATATFGKWLRLQDGVPADAASVQKIEGLCQSLEATRRALRAYLANPDIGLEWKCQYWVGRELAEIRGSTGCIEITPGVRTAWAEDPFTERPGLSPADHVQVKILLDRWKSVIDELRLANLHFARANVFGEDRSTLSIRDGGVLLAREYAYETQLLAFSAYPSVIPDLPLPRDLAFDASTARQVDTPTDARPTPGHGRTGALREPTDDDRIDFANEGVWGHLSRDERQAAISRAYEASWNQDGTPHHDGLSLVSNDDQIPAPDGDVEAWGRIWYLCRGIRPPGWHGSERHTASNTPQDQASPNASEWTTDQRRRLLRSLAAQIDVGRLGWTDRGRVGIPSAGAESRA
jgi:hypothetical protein